MFALPGYDAAAARIAKHVSGGVGKTRFGKFPDEETRLQVRSLCRGRPCVILAPLDRPDEKLVPLAFLAGTLHDQGAERVILVAPYLPYLRQDRAFHAGECVSALRFGSLVSSLVDGVVTVDPHLHRLASLGDAFSVPTRVVASAPATAAWIVQNVRDPVVIGPDVESRIATEAVARRVGAPFVVLEKVRRGDRDVALSFPDVTEHRGRTAVVVDDVVSTGVTLGAVLRGLRKRGLRAPVCVATHAVFAEGALEEIRRAGARRVVTTNTIPHATNAIDVDRLIAEAVRSLLGA